jgi:hypothetical protein
MFTLSKYGAQYKRDVVSASIGHPTSAIATGFRDPGHLPPTPPDRVRARPVLHLEEPAATLAVLTVVFVLVLLLVITRIVQRWLETGLLPHPGSSRASRTSTHNLPLQTASGAIG